LQIKQTVVLLICEEGFDQKYISSTGKSVLHPTTCQLSKTLPKAIIDGRKQNQYREAKIFTLYTRKITPAITKLLSTSEKCLYVNLISIQKASFAQRSTSYTASNQIGAKLSHIYI